MKISRLLGRRALLLGSRLLVCVPVLIILSRQARLERERAEKLLTLQQQTQQRECKDAPSLNKKTIRLANERRALGSTPRRTARKIYTTQVVALSAREGGALSA